MIRRLMLTLALIFSGLLGISELHAQQKPNILWIVQEDMSPWIGCYGDEINNGYTPVMDKLAANGVRFDRAFVSAPVCSSCRSGLIVGAPAFRFGAHHHRSRRGKAGRPLPEGMKSLPELFQSAGYETFNIGKTDYNFTSAKPLYSKFKNFPTALKQLNGKPFFGQIQLKGGKSKTKGFQPKTDPSKVTVPADYPQNELFKGIVAQHYDTIRKTDIEVGKILSDLKKAGLHDNTIVVMFSDHGANHLVRHKQMATEAGLHVPLIITGPEKWVPKKQVRKDLVSILDVAASSLSWAKIPHPKWIEGQDLFAKDFKPRPFVGSHRDRCDHTIDRVRTIRTDRFRYSKNFHLDRVLLQPQYRDPKPYTKFLRKSYAEGKLSDLHKKIYFGKRPAEELYDIEKDPAQTNNLATDPKYKSVLEEHRKLLDQWLAKGDLAEKPEPRIELVQNGNGRRHRGVNPEFESVRTDSDGDGLSDLWEKINSRDPEDGRLKFEFDCGGWQTEGWESSKKGLSIAGFQGFLEIPINDGGSSINRTGLNLSKEKNRGKLSVRLKCSSDTTLACQINQTKLGKQKATGGSWQTVSFPIDKNAPEKWNQIQFHFDSNKESNVEIDWIRVQ